MGGISANIPARRENNVDVATKTRNTTGVIFVTIKSFSRYKIGWSAVYRSEKAYFLGNWRVTRFTPYLVMDLNLVFLGLLRVIPNVLPDACDSLRTLRTMASVSNYEKQLKAHPIHLPPLRTNKIRRFSDILII